MNIYEVIDTVIVPHWVLLYWTGVIAVIVYMAISIWYHDMLCGDAVVMTLLLAFTLSWIGVVVVIANDLLNWISDRINHWLL